MFDCVGEHNLTPVSSCPVSYLYILSSINRAEICDIHFLKPGVVY